MHTIIKRYHYIFTAIFLALIVTTTVTAAEKADRVPVLLNWDCNCLTLSPDDIAKLVEDAKQSGADGINLRISNKGALNCRSKHGGPYTERLDAFGPDYDPLEILIRECRRAGIASCVWVDLFEAAYDPLILKHPEYSPQGRPSQPRLSGFPCYSHKEVRDHMLEVVDDFAAYRPDYVFFCTKSSHVPRNHRDQPHNRNSGFNPPVAEKYRELYGGDILNDKFDREMRERIAKIRGNFLVDYLVEARQRLNQAGVKVIAGATVSGLLQPGGPNLKLDWREIIRRRAADILLMANSRGEYYAFYDEKGQKLCREIVDACHKADMKFYAYIISSGTHSTISREFGIAGLEEYLPRQLDYLATLRADGVLIHDLDLFNRDRGVRRSLWSTLDARSVADPTGSKTAVPIPKPQLQKSLTPELSDTCYVPGASFESDQPLQWWVQSSWRTDRSSAPANGSFESYTNKHASPRGWTLQRNEKSVIEGVYDWKVMHDDPTSGRTYHARSSVMLQASGASGNSPETCTASWQATFPAIAPLPNQVVQVQVHGEDLSNIASTGMKIELLDADKKLLKTYQKEGPTDGTFAWQPLVIPCDLPKEAASVRVSLFMATKPKQAARGRIWFDRFEIRPQAEQDDLPDRVKTVQRTGGKDGAGTHLLVWMEQGHDLVCVPFRVDQSGKYLLHVTLRSTVKQEVQLIWQGKQGLQATKATVDPTWTTVELPIELPAADPAARIVLRPTKKAAIELKPLMLKKG